MSKKLHYRKWVQKDEWNSLEAACLLHKFNPEILSIKFIEEITEMNRPINFPSNGKYINVEKMKGKPNQKIAKIIQLKGTLETYTLYNKNSKNEGAELHPKAHPYDIIRAVWKRGITIPPLLFQLIEKRYSREVGGSFKDTLAPKKIYSEDNQKKAKAPKKSASTKVENTDKKIIATLIYMIGDISIDKLDGLAKRLEMDSEAIGDTISIDTIRTRIHESIEYFEASYNKDKNKPKKLFNIIQRLGKNKTN